MSIIHNNLMHLLHSRESAFLHKPFTFTPYDPQNSSPPPLPLLRVPELVK